MKDIALNGPVMNRRNFVATAAATVAALGASTALYGCDSRMEAATQVIGHAAPAPEGAEWKTLACLHGCGQRCMNQCLVKDGIVLRQKTDDTHEDSIEFPQQRGCLRGRSLYEFEMGADRIKYPMKRISWTPDDPHGELRGKEGYERISWDEALDLVSEQLRRVYTQYGPRSVFIPTSLSGSRMCYGPMMNALGGYLTVSDSVSYGTYTANTDMLGIAWGGECKMNDRLDVIENADVVVLYAQNPGWGANGNPSWNFRAAKERGARFFTVGPAHNVSAAMLDAEWIPVLPGSDTAFLIGVAGEMVKLDEEKGGIIDWDFVHTYCIGFDAQSMPKDAKTKEHYLGFLKGEYDGTVKDAAWASAICGTPADLITEFAEAMGKDNNCILSHGYAGARCNGAEDLPQAYMAIACLGGHFGKPGNGCGNLYVDRQGPGGVQIISCGSDGMGDFESPAQPLYDPKKVPGLIDDDFVNSMSIWDAIIDGKYTSTGDCWDGVYNKPVERECDIRVLWAVREGSARSVPNQAKMPEAMRKLDFVYAQNYTVSPTTMYADIILPTAAKIETNDLPGGDADHDREMILVYSKVSEPPYEAKSDQWICEQLLERLGYDPKDVYPYSEQQRFFNKLASTTISDPEGNAKPLVTVTKADLEAWGVDGTPQKGVVELDEICQKGIYQVERKFGDGYTHIAYQDFIEDPEGNPLDSASGKFEFYCQAKADQFNTAAMAGETYKPYPTVHEQPAEEGYPLLMFSSHHARAACSDFGNTATLRETFEIPVTMNAADAAELDIATGDPVLVSSPHGQILRRAMVSQLVIPGAIDVPNGAWKRVGDDGIDRGGCPNTLYGGAGRGMGVSGYNNVPVKVEKWTGEAPERDGDTQIIIEVSGTDDEQ